MYKIGNVNSVIIIENLDKESNSAFILHCCVTECCQEYLLLSHVTSNCKSCLGLHVKYQHFCLISTTFLFCRQIFIKHSNIKFY